MTDAAAVSAGVMTLDEFIRRSDQEGPFEILDGEIVPKMATVMGHGNVADNLSWAFNQHIRPTALGKVYTEAPYVLSYTQNWVKGARIPDLMFVSAERLKAYQESEPEWQSKPLVMVPDLVVEIVSPNDTFNDIDKRVIRYLSDGVKLIWVVNPQTKTVVVHTLGSEQQQKLSGDATLTGGGVLPDFQLKLSDLFA